MAASAKSPFAVTLVTESVAVPVLVSVEDCIGLVVPTVWLAKFKPPGDKLTDRSNLLHARTRQAYTLRTVGRIVCDCDGTGAAPVAVGVKVILIVQLAPTAMLVLQVLVCAKSPLAATIFTLKLDVPVLVTVTT